MANETIMLGKDGLPNIFRPEAINALNTIDNTEIEFNVSSPQTWLWVLASTLILISILICGALYPFTLTIEAPGIVMNTAEIMNAESAIHQYIKNKQDRLNELSYLYNKKSELYDNGYITRMDLLRAKEEYEAANNDLSENQKHLLIPIQQIKTPSHTTAIIFVDYQHGKAINLTMDGYITPTTALQSKVFGQVTGVSQYPVTKQLAYYYLQNAGLVDAQFNASTPFLVKISLEKNVLSPGTPIIASIHYKRCTALQMIIKSKECA